MEHFLSGLAGICEKWHASRQGMVTPAMVAKNDAVLFSPGSLKASPPQEAFLVGFDVSAPVELSEDDLSTGSNKLDKARYRTELVGYCHYTSHKRSI